MAADWIYDISESMVTHLNVLSLHDFTKGLLAQQQLMSAHKHSTAGI